MKKSGTHVTSFLPQDGNSSNSNTNNRKNSYNDHIAMIWRWVKTCQNHFYYHILGNIHTLTSYDLGYLGCQGLDA